MREGWVGERNFTTGDTEEHGGWISHSHVSQQQRDMGTPMLR